MELIKNIFYWNLKFIPFTVLKNIQKQKLMLPLYHIVSDDKVPHVVHCYSYKNIKQFENDLDILLKHFNPISLSDLMKIINKKEELHQKSFLLTIDDGYREIYDIMAPILLKKSIPAVFFLNSDFVDNKTMSYRNKASLLIDSLENKNNHYNDLQLFLKENDIVNDNLKSAILSIQYQQKEILNDIAKIMDVDFNLYLKEKKPFLTTEQISKLIEDGFDIGSHSIDHPLYKYLSLNEQLKQTHESFNFLKDKFPMPYRAFAFPHNDKGVKDFFKETHYNGDIEISFGTSGFNKGFCNNNLQRQSMENTNDSAKAIYKDLFKYEVFIQLKNSRFISNVFSKKNDKYILEDKQEKIKIKSERIRLERIKIKDLIEFTKKYNENKSEDDLAIISEQRALAHLNNPNADENDTGLILAYKENICVGYLGLMPGIADIRGIYEKIYFPSTWLVSDKVRGQSVGSLLMKEALSLGKALIGTGFNNNSERTWNYLGFEYMKSLHYTQINFEKFNLWFIRIADNFLNKLKKPTYQSNNLDNRYLYSCCKKFIYKRISKELKTLSDNIIFKEVDFINYEGQKTQNTENYRFFRSIDVINWMLKFQWIKSKSDIAEITKRDFYFSDVRDLFYYVAIEIFSKNTNSKLGYIIFSISKDRKHTTLKLLDHELDYKNKDKIFLGLIIKYASDVKADKIDITTNIAQQINASLFRSFLLKKIERRYLYYMADMSSRVAIAMKNITPDYCDGDLPFY